MLLFSGSWLLGFVPVIGVLGLWALWRGKHRVYPVSSARLWDGLVDAGAGRRKRRVDPAWFLVFLAAVLAALALSGPRWRWGGMANLPSARVEWSVRSIMGGVPELFVRISEGRNLGQTVSVEYLPNQEAEPWPENFKTAGEGVSVGEAMKGVIFQPPMSPEDGKLSLRLYSAGKVMGVATFVRPDRRAFGLLTRAGADRQVDAALYRVFAINPAARPGDPRVHPAVLLVDDPGFTLEGVDAGTLVVASATTRLPGVALGGSFVPAVQTPAAVSLPEFVRLRNVRVSRARGVTLAAEWTVEATVDGRPWLATRRMSAGGPMVVWLGSQAVEETNWPLESSFVLYFSDLLGRAFGELPPAAAGSADTRILDWVRADKKVAEGVQAGAPLREVGLSGPLGVAAIGLLMGAVGLLGWRARLG